MTTMLQTARADTVDVDELATAASGHRGPEFMLAFRRWQDAERAASDACDLVALKWDQFWDGAGPAPCDSELQDVARLTEAARLELGRVLALLNGASKGLQSYMRV